MFCLVKCVHGAAGIHFRAVLITSMHQVLALHYSCEHGAAAVISAVARGLGLPPKAAVPSLETLERFGSTMMCSTYYTLANLESQVSCC